MFYCSNVFGQEQLECLSNQEGVITLVGEKNGALYNQNKELLYVYNNDSDEYEFLIDGMSQVCFDPKLVTVKKSIKVAVTKEQHTARKYVLSSILLIYLIVLGGIGFILKSDYQVYNPFTVSHFPFLIVVLLSLLMGLLMSYGIEEMFFGKFFYAFVLLMAVKFLSSKLITFLFGVEENFGVIFSYIYKWFNILFLLFIILLLTFNANIDTSTITNTYFLIFIGVFVFSSLMVFVNSAKNIRRVHIFYYLCALEILPVLFLREYYI